MRRYLPIAILLLAVPSSFAADRQRVPADKVVAAALAALQAKASAEHVDARIASVGHADDVALAVDGEVELRAVVQDSWLRARIGVPVQVFVAGKKVSSVTTWFSITAPVRGLVYEMANPRGAAGLDVRTRIGDVDLARTHGLSMTAPDAFAAQRLHRAVQSGEPVLGSDFEAVPDVLAQQSVRVDAVSGTVRLSTTGRALADGRIGQVIAVLPNHASQPVRARIVSNKAVTIEN
jgi:flagella basal body P-ring formation protein FlgA